MDAIHIPFTCAITSLWSSSTDLSSHLNPFSTVLHTAARVNLEKKKKWNSKYVQEKLQVPKHGANCLHTLLTSSWPSVLLQPLLQRLAVCKYDLIPALLSYLSLSSVPGLLHKYCVDLCGNLPNYTVQVRGKAWKNYYPLRQQLLSNEGQELVHKRPLFHLSGRQLWSFVGSRLSGAISSTHALRLVFPPSFFHLLGFSLQFLGNCITRWTIWTPVLL